MSLMKCKVLLVFCNFLLLTCGCILVVGGLLVLLDADRILLSKLLTYPSLSPDVGASDNSTTTRDEEEKEGFAAGKPPLYYGAIGCATLGIFLVCIGTLGCWSSCLKNHCALTSYFLLVTTLLVGECAIFLIAWLWPHCLGLAMDSKHLSASLQKFYGTPGQEQFTAAVDLAQFTFRCCGIKGDKEYAKSSWKLKDYRPGLSFPLTCCKLPGEEEYEYESILGFSLLSSSSSFSWRKPSKSQLQRQQYLDPQPVNVTLCQEMHSDRPNGFRHAKGCGEDLESWFQRQYVIFLGGGLILVLVEFASLLSTVLVCSQIFRRANKKCKNQINNINVDVDSINESKRRQRQSRQVEENFYERTGTISTTTINQSQAKKTRNNPQSHVTSSKIKSNPNVMENPAGFENYQNGNNMQIYTGRRDNQNQSQSQNNSPSAFQSGNYVPGMSIDDGGSLNSNRGTLKA